MSNELKITSHEISSCGDASQIAGVGGFRNHQVLVLKFVYDNTDTQIVCLNANAIPYLVGVLKTLVAETESKAIDALDLLVNPDTGGKSTWSPS